MAAEQAEELSPGTLVARRYRVVQTIGAGGYGAVYQAVDSLTARPLALKVLHRARTERARDTRRFRREAALLQQLRHPNVLDVYEFAETEDGILYIACEMLAGTSLRDELKARGAFGLWRTLHVGRAVVAALAYAHDAGIVHRDVKPANVMLCAAPPGELERVKLLDFGIAKALYGDESETQLTATGQMLGTPHYMTPEQVHGLRVGPSVDTYALGLMLAEMLTGRRVVRGASHLEVCMQHASEAPHTFAPEVLASPLGPIIVRAAQKPIAARYTSAHELAAALDEVARGVPPPAAAPATSATPASGPPAGPSTLGASSLERALSGPALAPLAPNPGAAAAGARQAIAQTIPSAPNPPSVERAGPISAAPMSAPRGTVVMEAVPEAPPGFGAAYPQSAAQPQEAAYPQGALMPRAPSGAIEATLDAPAAFGFGAGSGSGSGSDTAGRAVLSVSTYSVAPPPPRRPVSRSGRRAVVWLLVGLGVAGLVVLGIVALRALLHGDAKSAPAQPAPSATK